jgi:NAD+-dependent protein deacetylase SIR2
MFDIEVFHHDPSIFYSFAHNLLPSSSSSMSTRYSPTHAFLKLLQDTQKLLRVYTQNIDNLEHLAGVGEDKLVQCHGSFATASCVRCGMRVAGEEILQDVRLRRVPKCVRCEGERLAVEGRRGKGRKRRGGWREDDEDEEDDIIEGIIKVLIPPIHPPRLIDTNTCISLPRVYAGIF